MNQPAWHFHWSRRLKFIIFIRKLLIFQFFFFSVFLIFANGTYFTQVRNLGVRLGSCISHFLCPSHYSSLSRASSWSGHRQCLLWSPFHAVSCFPASLLFLLGALQQPEWAFKIQKLNHIIHLLKSSVVSPCFKEEDPNFYHNFQGLWGLAPSYHLISSSFTELKPACWCLLIDCAVYRALWDILQMSVDTGTWSPFLPASQQCFIKLVNGQSHRLIRLPIGF